MSAVASGSAPGAVDVTPWFSINERPTRTGFYEFRLTPRGDVFRLRYDGLLWFGPLDDYADVFPACAGDEWRGLTKRAAATQSRRQETK